MEAPKFWDNPEKAQQIIQQLKPLNGLLNPFEDLQEATGDLAALAELTEEEISLEPELEAALTRLETELADFEMKAMLGGPLDASSAFVKIQAGAGGTEACDWA